MPTLNQLFVNALEAASRGEGVPDSQLPKRGSADWKSLTARQKTLVKNARFYHRENLRKKRLGDAASEELRWIDRVWKVHAGEATFSALVNPGYSARTATGGPAIGTVDIVVGSRLGYHVLAKKIPAASDKIWAIKNALSLTHYNSTSSAASKAGPVIRQMAAGKVKVTANIPDDTD